MFLKHGFLISVSVLSVGVLAHGQTQDNNAPSAWDTLQTTNFRPALASYAHPAPLLHPINPQVCHTIVTKHDQAVVRLTREHRECLNGFHAPPRSSEMSESSCTLEVCKALHWDMWLAKKDYDLAARYESDCLKSYAADHKKSAPSVASKQKTATPTKQTSFLDDPVGGGGSTSSDSVSQEIVEQRKRNKAAYEQGVNYQASYTVSPKAPDPAKVRYGFCTAVIWGKDGINTEYFSAATPIGGNDAEVNEAQANWTTYITSVYGPPGNQATGNNGVECGRFSGSLSEAQSSLASQFAHDSQSYVRSKFVQTNWTSSTIKH